MGKEFLRWNLGEREKWARAYDHGGLRYGDMTSNMAECFNSVLKGVRQLPVTAIAKYTFPKLNEYFLKYSKETKKQILGLTKNKKKYKYPSVVHKWMEYQTKKSGTQTSECFDTEELIYQVNELGGTTRGGVQHGGISFKVWLKKELALVRGQHFTTSLAPIG
jgi:hypothetical protein